MTMTSRTAKVVALVAMGGLVMQFGGCLGGNVLRTVVTDAALSATYEFLWDNDSVFDLFPDDFGTGTEYDDRMTADPTRDEVEGSTIQNFTQP
jgi:hypothetical protein